jgi:hypothetical protein
MSIDARDAVEELIADCFAGDRGPAGENFLDHGSMLAGRFLRRKPIRIAAAGPRPGNVVHVLDDRREAGKRASGRTNNRRL